MADDDRRAESVPIRLAVLPSEFMHERRDEWSVVRTAAGDDHIGAAGQGVDDAVCAKIRVGGHDPVANTTETLFAGVHIAKRDAVRLQHTEFVGDVITAEYANLQAA